MSETLKAIEGYLANKADHGDALATALRDALFKERALGATVYVVVRGGVVQYVSSTNPGVYAEVIDIDDLQEDRDAGTPDNEKEAQFAYASSLVRVY